MTYRLQISQEALHQLRALPLPQRQRVGERIERLRTNLQGDVRKLAGQSGKYRLRVGAYRVLFTLENDLILIHFVKDRKDAYRD